MEYVVAAAVSVNNTEAPLTLLVGETVVLECVASGAYPGAQLRWFVDGLETEVSDGNSTGKGSISASSHQITIEIVDSF